MTVKLNNIISKDKTIKNALKLLDQSGEKLLLVLDNNDTLIGTLSDGDIRRGWLNGLKIDDNFDDAVNKTTKYIRKDNYSIKEIVVSRIKST